jgi:Fe-S cluster assembly protein SufD
LLGFADRIRPHALPGGRAVLREREDAWRRFSARGFPTRRDEHWRYTDIRPISEGDFALHPQSTEPDADRAAGVIAQSGLAVDGPRVVFVDGIYSAELSTATQDEEITIESLADSWATLDAGFSDPTHLENHPLALLNTAAVEHGAIIRLPENSAVRKTLTLVHVGMTSQPLAVQSRVLVELARGSRLTLVQEFVDAGADPAWLNIVTQIRQAPASRLQLYSSQQHGTGAFHTSLVQASLGEHASLHAAFLDTGGRIARRDIEIRLEAPGANTELRGVFLANDGQHVDNHIRVDHVAPETSSFEAFRGIIGKGGRGVFNGKVVVHEGAQGTDARQRSDNLLLDESAEIDTKPELEIYADDVKCSHGATVGELDDAHLFYLRSRGVEESAARALLTFAFANSVVEQISMPEFREAAARRIAASLPEHELWESLV